MTVVSEGVETADNTTSHPARLDACQGFYFARPMPATSIDTLIQTDGANPRLPSLVARSSRERAEPARR